MSRLVKVTTDQDANAIKPGDLIKKGLTFEKVSMVFKKQGHAVAFDCSGHVIECNEVSEYLPC